MNAANQWKVIILKMKLHVILEDLKMVTAVNQLYFNKKLKKKKENDDSKIEIGWVLALHEATVWSILKKSDKQQRHDKGISTFF